MVLTNIAMVYMALIEIDGLPSYIAWWIFPWHSMAMLVITKSLAGMFQRLGRAGDFRATGHWLISGGSTSIYISFIFILYFIYISLIFH